MLEKIQRALEAFDDMGYYFGLAPEEDPPQAWNYFVVSREKMLKKETSLDFSTHYAVTIYREEEIPQEYEFAVMKAVMDATGMRPANEEFLFEYVIKEGAGTMVEKLKLLFAKASIGAKVLN